jgi:hypothetical protein
VWVFFHQELWDFRVARMVDGKTGQLACRPRRGRLKTAARKQITDDRGTGSGYEGRRQKSYSP